MGGGGNLVRESSVQRGSKEVFDMERYSKRVVLMHALRLFCLFVLLFGIMALPRDTSEGQDQQPKPLAIAMDSLPDGATGQYYGVTIYASGGKRPYGFSATGLPDGLYISRNSDRIMGMPKTAGTYMPVITVEDSALPTSSKASATLKLVVIQK